MVVNSKFWATFMLKLNGQTKGGLAPKPEGFGGMGELNKVLCAMYDTTLEPTQYKSHASILA